MSALLERLRSALSPRYDVQRLLATGGMARVYLARDTRLDRAVAVKVLRPELATATGAERFLQEARILARLRHSHVLAVHEVGAAEGLYFCVTDYVQGENLRDRLQRGPLPEREALRLGEELLEALDVAHREGIVHRDVKPENLFLEDGRLILADFGVARDLGREGDRRLTVPEQRPGTPAYMSPEQAAGEEVTPRSDLYAAGMVIYEAFTGIPWWPPFRSPGDADWQGVPRPVVPVLTRALATDPSARWPDARSFAAALGATRRAGARRRISLLVALVLVAAVAGGLIIVRGERGAAGGATGAAGAADLAVLPCDAVPREDSSLARDLAYLTARNLETVPELRVVRRSTAFRWWNAAGREAAPDAAEGARILGASLATRCLFLRRGDSASVQLELVDPEGHVVRGIELRGTLPTASRGVPDALASQLAVRIAGTLVPRIAITPASFRALEQHPSLAWHAFLRGEAAYERNDWSEAERHYTEALSHDSSFALAHWRMVDVRRWLQTRTPLDIVELCRETPRELGPADRMVLEARCLGHGPGQIEALRTAAREFPDEAYTLFSYGDELFHRGPLWGIGEDSAAAVLAAAARRDSFFAPSFAHLAWAEIRRGRRDPSRLAVDRLFRIAGGGREAVYGPAMLRLAWLERFDTAAADRGRQAMFGAADGAAGAGNGAARELLALASRWGLAFDLPAAQLGLSRQLASSAGVRRGEELTARVAAGAALVALGRPVEATAHFDSAAALADDAETRLQAEEWALLPVALGLFELPPDIVAPRVGRMEALASDPELSPEGRARAATALALLAYHREGAREEVRRWEAAVEAAVSQGASGRHRTLLDGFRRASAGRYGRALESTRSLLAHDDRGRTLRPFHRATLYLARAEWFRRQDRGDSARASWRWHGNVDAAGKLAGPAQAADVDWALAPYARLLSARSALEDGDSRAACSDARRALRYWRSPEAPLEGRAREARRVVREACDP